MIYTSYFNNVQNLPDNVIPIAICAKSPDNWHGREYKKLAPKYHSFMKWKENKNNEYYITHFFSEVLDHLDAKQVRDELFEDIPEGCTVAMICYEKPEKFCHRHLVANWFNKYGIQCEEYKV